MIPAATLSFCASTLNNSTSLSVVFKVVKSPFAVRLPSTVKLPVTAASLTVILSVFLILQIQFDHRN